MGPLVELHPEIWVVGYPSLFGGADTELDHNIDLWRSFGVEVHLVPTGGPNAAAMRSCGQEKGSEVVVLTEASVVARLIRKE